MSDVESIIEYDFVYEDGMDEVRSRSTSANSAGNDPMPRWFSAIGTNSTNDKFPLVTDFMDVMAEGDEEIFFSDDSLEVDPPGDEFSFPETSNVGSVNVANVAGDLTSLAVCGDGFHTWHDLDARWGKIRSDLFWSSTDESQENTSVGLERESQGTHKKLERESQGTKKSCIWPLLNLSRH